MGSIIIHFGRIKEIIKDGIFFVDEENEKHFIDFKECRKNWVEFAKNSDEMSCTDLKEDETNCVGWRNCIGKPSFIEIFSNPRVKFVLSCEQNIFEKLFRRESKKCYQEFYKVQKSINEWLEYY